jgi:hypothetical protein
MAAPFGKKLYCRDISKMSTFRIGLWVNLSSRRTREILSRPSARRRRAEMRSISRDQLTLPAPCFYKAARDFGLAPTSPVCLRAGLAGAFSGKSGRREFRQKVGGTAFRSA